MPEHIRARLPIKFTSGQAVQHLEAGERGQFLPDDASYLLIVSFGPPQGTRAFGHVHEFAAVQRETVSAAQVQRAVALAHAIAR